MPCGTKHIISITPNSHSGPCALDSIRRYRQKAGIGQDLRAFLENPFNAKTLEYFGVCPIDADFNGMA